MEVNERVCLLLIWLELGTPVGAYIRRYRVEVIFRVTLS